MIYLKFDTEIKGDVSAKGYEDQIKIWNFSFDVQRAMMLEEGAKTRKTGVAKFQDITCNKTLDISSSELFNQSICGESLVKATFTFLQNEKEPKPYLKLELGDPIISFYSMSNTTGQMANETFRISYASIKMTFTELTGESDTPATPKGWNLLEAKAA